MASGWLADYIEFVEQYMDEEERSRDPGAVQAEYHSLNTAERIQCRKLIDDLDVLDIAIEDTEEVINSVLENASMQWSSLSPRQQQDRNDVEGSWEKLDQLHRQRIDVLGACRQRNFGNGQARLLNQALEEHISVCEDLLQEFIDWREPFEDPPETQGSKVRGDPQPVSSEMHKLCQKQVLPPAPQHRSESSSGPFDKAYLDKFHGAGHFVGEWIGRNLGEGGQGVAKLYEFTDNTGNVTTRVVRKDTAFRETENWFRDPRDWHGDTSKATFRNECVPMEYHTQQIVSSAPSSTNTVKFLGPPQVVWSERKYRLYTQFEPNGDASDLIRKHDNHEEPVPELFLWMVFQALLNSALIMKQGGILAPARSWSQIVHCDIKAANVFLGLPDPYLFPQYPKPKLGDFGLAFPTNKDDKTNPIMWSERGTPGHFAPEQLYWINDVTQEPYEDDKMLSPCNVYGAATVIYQLMERKVNLGYQPQYTTDAQEATFEISDVTRLLYGDETNGLVDLVEQCLNSDPAERPEVEDLFQRVNNRLYSDNCKNERLNGFVDDKGDTLLLPGQEVRLKWASRVLAAQEGNIGPRVPRGSPTTSTVRNTTVPTETGMDTQHQVDPGAVDSQATITAHGDSDTTMTDVEPDAAATDSEMTDTEMTDVEDV